MNKTFAVVIALVPLIVVAADSPLIRLRLVGGFGPNGDQSLLQIEEVTRTDNSSIVEVTGPPPGSDFAFIVRLGFCKLAEARGKSSLQATQISNEPMRFEVKFTDALPTTPSTEKASDPRVFPLMQCPTSIP